MGLNRFDIVIKERNLWKFQKFNLSSYQKQKNKKLIKNKTRNKKLVELRFRIQLV